MKLIIDIPKELKSAVYNCGLFLTPAEKMSLIDAINNGTPIPDNATNGNVITEILKSSNDMHSTRNIGLAQEDTIYIEVGSNWWNAPYQKEDKNE